MNENNNMEYNNDNFVLYMFAAFVLLVSAPVIFMIFGQIALETPTEKLWTFFRNVAIFDLLAYMFVRFRKIKGGAKVAVYVLLMCLLLVAFMPVAAEYLLMSM